MNTENTLVICDLVSLQMWKHQLVTLVRPSNLPDVQFQLQEFSYEQNQNLSVLADGFRKACGCTSSGLFMSIAAVATVVSYFMSGNHLSTINFANILSFLGIIVLAALSGKLLGLLWARLRLLKLATKTQHTIVITKRKAAVESL